MLNIVQKIKNVFKLKCILQKSKFYVKMIIFVKLKHRTDIIEHIHFFDAHQTLRFAVMGTICIYDIYPFTGIGYKLITTILKTS